MLSVFFASVRVLACPKCVLCVFIPVLCRWSVIALGGNCFSLFWGLLVPGLSLAGRLFSGLELLGSGFSSAGRFIAAVVRVARPFSLDEGTFVQVPHRALIIGLVSSSHFLVDDPGNPNVSTVLVSAD